MTFIEGIGDEVTAFFVVLVVVVLATLVTFISSGAHLYSPAHTRSVHIAVLSSREAAETVTTVHTLPEPPSEEPPSAPPEETTEPESEEEEEEAPSDSDETQRPPENDQPESEATVLQQEEAEEDGSQGIRVRLKYLDDTERTVRSSPTTKVIDFKRAHFREDLSANRVVRLISCGHLLRDNSTLHSYRVVDNSVLHVQVLAAQPQQASRATNTGQQPELDLSHLLWPLVSVILGMCWVFYFKYPEFFSVISLSLLFVFTASFFVFYTQVH